MIYVAVIVAICLAELLIRRYINQNVEEDGQKWGKCGVRLRKYHNYGMANDKSWQVEHMTPEQVKEWVTSQESGLLDLDDEIDDDWGFDEDF